MGAYERSAFAFWYRLDTAHLHNESHADNSPCVTTKRCHEANTKQIIILQDLLILEYSRPFDRTSLEYTMSRIFKFIICDMVSAMYEVTEEKRRSHLSA